MRDTYQSIVDKLDEFDSFLLTSHPAPDGDALGSCLAFYDILKKKGKEVTFMVIGYVEHKIKFLLEGIDYVEHPAGKEGQYQCVVAFDIGDPSRIQDVLDAAGAHSPFVINIDHHASNKGFANIDLVDTTASSSGEIVYNVLKEGNLTISPEVATALYTAVASDTGFFTYSNTNSHTLQVASELLNLGAKQEMVTRHVLRSKPLKSFQLEANYVSSVQFSPQGKLVWGVVSREQCEKYGVYLREVSGFIEIPRNIEGVAVSVLFRHSDKDGKVKLSLRSNDSDLDVNVFASRYGGGGHPRAAGCMLEGDLHEKSKEVVESLIEYYREKKGEEP